MARDLSQARAILIGSGRFQHPRISDLPAAECVAAIAGLLAGDLCGWPAERIVRLENVATSYELNRRVITEVKDAQDVLLVYYIGHGFRTRTGQLALAVSETDLDQEALRYTAVLYEDLADIMRGCRAATKLVILDCCHAELGGKANYVFQGDDLADAYPVDGLYFIGASKSNEKAKTPVGSELTYFTQALVDVVRGGIPGQGPELRLDQIFLEMRARLVRARLPEPVESGIRGARQYALVRNVAWPEFTPVRMPEPRPTAGRVGYITNQDPARNSILAKLAELLEETVGVPTDEVRMDADFGEDLDVDSLSSMEMMVAAEEKFGIVIPDDSIRGLRTVRDAVELIQKLQ
jgi:acyl carrier protein